MDENAFLKGREERDALRLARARAGPSDDATHRAELLQELEALAASIRSAIEVEKSHDGALALWRQLQQHITSAADTKTLPAHEMKLWNKCLSDLSASMEELRTVAKGPKKFAFSSKKAAAPPPVVVVPPPVEAPSSSPAAANATTADEDQDVVGGAVFSDLRDVTVFVPAKRAVFVRRCHNCTFLALPTAGSFFISDSSACRVYLCCHQLRIKSSNELHVFAWCASTPVIESCTSMTFGPYSKWRGLLTSSYVAPDGGAVTHGTHELWATTVGEIRDVGHATSSWKSIDDFHWLKQAQSPNWTLITEEALNSDAFVVDEATLA